MPPTQIIGAPKPPTGKTWDTSLSLLEILPANMSAAAWRDESFKPAFPIIGKLDGAGFSVPDSGASIEIPAGKVGGAQAPELIFRTTMYVAGDPIARGINPKTQTWQEVPLETSPGFWDISKARPDARIYLDDALFFEIKAALAQMLDTRQAAALALAVAGIDRNFISATNANPTTVGAVTGTKGVRRRVGSWDIEFLVFQNGAWVFTGFGVRGLGESDDGGVKSYTTNALLIGDGAGTLGDVRISSEAGKGGTFVKTNQASNGGTVLTGGWLRLESLTGRWYASWFSGANGGTNAAVAAAPERQPSCCREE